METRVFFVVLIAVLFWIAPSPQSSEAHSAKQPVLAARVTVSSPNISIKPYLKSDHAK